MYRDAYLALFSFHLAAKIAISDKEGAFNLYETHISPIGQYKINKPQKALISIVISLFISNKIKQI